MIVDDADVRRTEAQFALWSAEIERRAARLAVPGREARFAAVLDVDELRVLLATVRFRWEALQAATGGNRALSTAEFDNARQELAAAIGRRMPRP